jgi:putative glutamine transport system permease protein
MTPGSLGELIDIDFFLFLGRGLLVTLKLASISLVLGTLFGVLIGIVRYSKAPVLGALAGFYVEAIRNSPLLLLILMAKFALQFQKENAAILALSAFTAAMLAEIVRGGLASIDKGQWEAARAQGFNYLQTLQYVILPQALRKMIPPIFSQFITLLKDTSYYWWIGGEELTGRGMILVGKYGSTLQVFAVFGFIALVYYLLCNVLTQIARRQERKMAWLSF